jgi:hypothetical protein
MNVLRPSLLSRRKRASFVFVSSVMALLSSGASADPDAEIQLLYPENNVSAQPFIEFRARWFDKDDVGHAYIVLGRKLDNGLEARYAMTGFWPKAEAGHPTDWEMIKRILYGPGELKLDKLDLSYKSSFKVWVTEEQERKALDVFERWEGSEYALLWHNCSDFVSDVAHSVGLKTTFAGVNTPERIIKNLESNNDPRRPLEAAKEESRRRADELKAVNSYSRQQYRIHGNDPPPQNRPSPPPGPFPEPAPLPTGNCVDGRADCTLTPYSR